jgi:hypothetical protein
MRYLTNVLHLLLEFSYLFSSDKKYFCGTQF